MNQNTPHSAHLAQTAVKGRDLSDPLVTEADVSRACAHLTGEQPTVCYSAASDSACPKCGHLAATGFGHITVHDRRTRAVIGWHCSRCAHTWEAP